MYVALNLSDREERVGFNVDGGYGKLTDVLNDNEIFEASGYVEVPIPAHSARILVLNDGSFTIYIQAKQNLNPSLKCRNLKILTPRYSQES